MIGSDRVLALIPARGGSKGVPRKNVRLLGGVPLIEWTIRAALSSDMVDEVVVSTDDHEIGSVAERAGAVVPFLRPADLSTDMATSGAVIEHALKELPGFDVVVLLQPTSPFRNVGDIDRAIGVSRTSRAPVVSVTESSKHPRWMFEITPKGVLRPTDRAEMIVTNRQQLPKVFVLNGAVYVSSTGSFLETGSFLTSRTRAYIMPAERSIDIDSEFDWLFAEYILEKTREGESQ